MKYLFLTMIFISTTFSVISQNVYVKIDTREKEICGSTEENCPNCIGGKKITYHIYKTVKEDPYLGELALEYLPYPKEYVKGKESYLKAHRTNKVSKKDLRSQWMYNEIELVIDFNWIESHSWYDIDWIMRAAKHIYIIDKKYETKDSFLVREVDYVDTASQVCKY